eukprot:jgi/Chlat1/3720/Chrsp258S03873
MVDLRSMISSTAGNDSHSGPELAAISKSAASGAQSNNQAADPDSDTSQSVFTSFLAGLENKWVFLSYCQRAVTHVQKVSQLAWRIHACGFEVVIDQIKPYSMAWAQFIAQGFAEGTKVLVVGDPDYVRIAKRDNTSTYDDGHGVSVEWLQISTRIFNQHNAGNAACTSGGNRETRLPELLQSWTYHQIDPDSECDPGSEGLLDYLNDVLPKLQVHHPTED